MTMQAISLYERVVIRRSPYLDLALPGSTVSYTHLDVYKRQGLHDIEDAGAVAGGVRCRTECAGIVVEIGRAHV